MTATGRKRDRRWTACCLALALGATLVCAGSARAALHWSKAYRLPGADQGISAISCPTIHLCLAAAAVGNPRSTGTNDIFWTIDPRGGRTSWHHVALEPSVQPPLGGERAEVIAGISCTRTGSGIRCSATDGFGNLWQSSAPASGHWSSQIPTSVGLLGASCWSADCAVLDSNANVAVLGATSVLGVTSDVFGVSQGLSGGAISCNRSGLCAATDLGHRVRWTAHATAAMPVWRRVTLTGRATISSIACPGAHLCVASEGAHGFASLIGLWQPGRSWRSVRLPGADRSLYGVACPSVSFCAISGSQGGVAGPGYVLASTRPAAIVSAWRRQRVPVPMPAAIGCASASLCVVGDGQDGRISVGS